MEMIVEKIEESDFSNSLKEINLNSNYLLVNSGLKFHLEGILEVDLAVDLWRIRDGQRCVYTLVKHNTHKSLMYVETNCYEEKFLTKVAALFAQALYDLVKESDYVFGFAIMEPLVDLFERELLNLGIRESHPFKTLEDRDNVYYVNEAGRKILETEEPQIPEGYKWGMLEPSHAAEVMADQVYGKITSPKPYERTLSLLPSVAVFTEDTNELASYEFLDVTGAITSQFTRHAHRRKGLGSAVEWKLCAESWKKIGLIPFKAVSHNRPRVLKLSDNSPIWTQQHDEQGALRSAKFFLHSKVDMPRIEFYEN